MKTIPILNKDGTEAGSFDPQSLLDELNQLIQANSSANEAKLSDIQGQFNEQGKELARLRDIHRSIGNQMSTVEGFAEMARIARLFDAEAGGDLAFISFADHLGKGHLVKALDREEQQAALADMEKQAEADETERIAEALMSQG